MKLSVHAVCEECDAEMEDPVVELDVPAFDALALDRFKEALRREVNRFPDRQLCGSCNATLTALNGEL